jgi:hypothetical protein
MRTGKAALGFVLASALVVAGSAQALTLADLNGGQSLTVGPLTFSDFTTTVTGALDPNLADYKVVTLSDGFEIVGNISAFNGQQGDMLVSYDVSAAQGSAVDDITLKFDGNASGPHSGATVSEDLFAGGNSIASAHVFSTGSGGSQKVDTATFAPQTSFMVEKDILVTAGPGISPPPSSENDNDQGKDDNGQGDDEHNGDKNLRHHDMDSDHHGKGKVKETDLDESNHHIKDLDETVGGSATISFVDQRFSVVPEPGSLVLLGGGLTGLLVFGRKRKS